MASKQFLCLLLPIVIFMNFQLSLCRIAIEVKFLNYADDCREDASTSKCDPKFRFCIDKPRETTSIKSCYYATTTESGFFKNTNHINFSEMRSIKGVPNPWVVYTAQLMDPSIVIIFQVRDDDFFTDDDHLQTWGVSVTVPVYPSIRDAHWTSYKSTSNSHTMTFQIRLYCEEGHYSATCKNYCKASDSPAGHYECDPDTGAKICAQGKNCTIVENACDSHPCSNNATCTEMPDFGYHCTCIGDWEGQNCVVKLDPCKNGPCQNGAKCTSSADHANYFCDCQHPYTGINCDTTIPDLTKSQAPNLTKSQPSTSRESTTSVIDVSSTKLPVLTQESMVAVTIKQTNVGNNNIGSVAAQQTNIKEETNEDNPVINYWYGILIGLIVLCVIISIIIFLVVRQRRRKQKLSTDEAVIVYQNNNKLSFENNLYNDVNTDQLKVTTERQREQTPLPSTPTETDKFPAMKPVFTPNNLEVQGAEGGISTEIDIDMDADGYVKPKSSKSTTYKKMIEKPQRSEHTENNYTDFNKLKGNQDRQDSAEDLHFYHDLDEIALAVKRLNNGVREKNCMPLPVPTPKIDEDWIQNKSYAVPSSAEEIAYTDTPSNRPVEENSYGNINNSDDCLPGPFVHVPTAQENLYTEPDKPLTPSQPEPAESLKPAESLESAERSTASACELNEKVTIDIPQTSITFDSKVASADNVLQDYGLGLLQVSLCQDGDYSTPRSQQVDAAALEFVPECQYDIPPNSGSSKILAGNYNGVARSSET